MLGARDPEPASYWTSLQQWIKGEEIGRKRRERGRGKTRGGVRDGDEAVKKEEAETTQGGTEREI